MNRMNRISRNAHAMIALSALCMTSVVIPTSTGIGENTAGSDANLGVDPETGKLAANTTVATIGETDPSTMQAPAIPTAAAAETAAPGTEVVSTPVVPEGGAAPAAPAVPETKAQEKARLKKEAADKKAKEKADAAAAKAAAAPAEPKAPADEKNSVTRPASGKTKQVWDVADAMSKELKAPVARKDLTDKLLADPYNLVVGTIHTQYGKWRKYHGLVAEKAAAAPAAPAAPEVPVAPTAPAA